MSFLRRGLVAVIIVIFSLVAWLSPLGHFWLPVSAQNEETPPPAPQRQTTITVKYTAYEWWLSRWRNNKIVCRVIIDHEGRPTDHEIAVSCSENVSTEWKQQEPCPAISKGESTKECTGYYLQLAWSGPSEKKVVVDLPMPSVWLTVQGCKLEPPNNRCKNPPVLILTGEEPLPNELIIRIQGTINGRPFSCPGYQCAIPLQPTGMQGMSIEFWGASSFGDESEHYTARVRVLPWGDFMDPEGQSTDQKLYYVDVISSQFREGALTSCSDVWETFPEIGGPPAWLNTPKTADGLNSSQGYYYLAGMLIQNGIVDASACPDGGLDQPGVANNCGVDVARPQLVQWQNQFNNEILDVARETGIPAQLMKNIFSRESQFWPGLYKNFQEAGLGQLTENGADTLFLWNPVFFKQFCPLVLDRDICNQRTYGGMTDPDTEGVYDDYMFTLRNMLVKKVNATCEDCPLGIDLTQAKFSIRVFAESLTANCNQVGQMVFNTTDQMPGEVTNFTDLWKMTLVNYNAGPGCLGDAIDNAWNENEKLDWASVAGQLPSTCGQGAIDYVNEVTNYPPPAPTPTPAVIIGPATPTAGPVFVETPTSVVSTPTRGAPTLPRGSATSTPTRTPTPTLTTEEAFPTLAAPTTPAP